MGVVDQAEPAVSRTERQVADRTLHGLAQRATAAQRKTPDAERRDVVLEPQFETQGRDVRQGQHQVFDQSHFLFAGNQRIGVAEVRFFNTGAEQAGCAVNAIAGRKIDHHLTDDHRVKQGCL